MPVTATEGEGGPICSYDHPSNSDSLTCGYQIIRPMQYGKPLLQEVADFRSQFEHDMARSAQESSLPPPTEESLGVGESSFYLALETSNGDNAQFRFGFVKSSLFAQGSCDRGTADSIARYADYKPKAVAMATAIHGAMP